MDLIDNLNELLDNGATYEEALSQLTMLYKNSIRQINETTRRLEIKNKTMIFWIILFFYVWVTFTVGTMIILKNSILQNLIGWPAVLGNFYVYIKFSEYYISEEQNEIERCTKEKNRLYIEISKALTMLNIEKEDYFSSIN